MAKSYRSGRTNVTRNRCSLMSCLGSIGNLMTGSGIEQVLQLIYGKDVVPHIISGKAISRALMIIHPEKHLHVSVFG